VGHLEKLAWQELYHRREAGRLGVSYIFSMGQALFSKKLPHQVVARGTLAAHLALWSGQAMGHYIPRFAKGANAQNAPAPLVQAWKVFRTREAGFLKSS
jgi:hypothetical protein